MSEAKPTTRSHEDPIVLTPIHDPATDTVFYSLPEPEAATIAERPAATPDDIELVAGRSPALVRVNESGDQQQDRIPLSNLPPERMAVGDDWRAVREMIENQENGAGPDVTLVPGGGFVKSESGGYSQQISTLPQERMASVNEGPLPEDVDLLRQLDPHNIERWQPVYSGFLSGWKFQMQPPYPGQQPFVFFAFRSPRDGNAFRITPIYPNMDGIVSHKDHMVTQKIGNGKKVPVLCGPGGYAASTLAEVRTHAAKWMAYTSLLMADKKPRFSK